MMASWSLDSSDVGPGPGTGPGPAASGPDQPPLPASAASASSQPRASPAAPAPGPALAPSPRRQLPSPTSRSPVRAYRVGHTVEGPVRLSPPPATVRAGTLLARILSQPQKQQPRQPPGRRRTYRFRFGIAAEGDGGEGGGRHEGRRDEHEVVLRWDGITGRRTVTCDGRVVADVTSRGQGVCDHGGFSVSVPGGGRRGDDDDDHGGRIELRIMACQDPPLGAAPGFRTGELLVGGTSYYDLPELLDGDGNGARLALVPPRGRPPLAVHPRTGRTMPTSVAEVLCPEAVGWSGGEEAAFVDEGW